MYSFIVLLLVLNSVAYGKTNVDGESIPAGENKAISHVVDLIRASVREEFDRTGHAVRDAHRKSHGCVRAQFTVNCDLAPSFRQGIFAKPSSRYEAIIRFSNGSGLSQDDRVGDGRGMAIKLLNVEGPKVLEDEPTESTQDFLMINYPVFFVRNAIDYVDFQEAVSSGTFSILWWFTQHIFHEGWIAKQMSAQEMINPLQARYWSMTASKLGSRQMKFSTEPCPGAQFKAVSFGENRLRENMTDSLARSAACFDFKIQLRTRPETMPIEDPTIEWEEAESPFTKVAQIEIPEQTPMQGEACDILSYTPWHTSPELRPLGGISRVRKEVYREISKLRHELNGQPRKEP